LETSIRRAVNLRRAPLWIPCIHISEGSANAEEEAVGWQTPLLSSLRDLKWP